MLSHLYSVIIEGDVKSFMQTKRKHETIECLKKE